MSLKISEPSVKSSDSKSWVIPWGLVIGTGLEWFEFSLFAYFARDFSRLFFPPSDPGLSQLKTYMIFGVSYLARPLGAVAFGYLGDTRGRKPTLLLSIVMMSLATACMGLLPTYASIGVIAPLLLSILRMVQGFCVAGEFNGSNILLVEQYGSRRPYAAGLWTPLSASLGMSLGSLSSYLAHGLFAGQENLWRVPFLLCAFGCLVGVYLRRNLQESEGFLRSIKPRRPRPLRDALRLYPKACWLAFTAAMLVSNLVYLFGVFGRTLMLQLGRHSPSVASGMIVYGQLLASFMILICGLRVDASKIDEDRWLRRSVLLVMVFALPITLMQSSASVLWLFLGQTLYGLVNGTLSSVVMTYVSRCFPVTCRYSGVSTCWSVSAAIFGGSALLVGEILFQRELGLLIGVYVALSSLALYVTAGRCASPGERLGQDLA